MGTSHEKHQEARIVLMHCWCTLDISITLGRTFHFNTIWADTDQGSSLRWSVSDRTHARDSGGSPDTCLSQVRVRSVVTAFMEAGKVWMGCLCLKHGLAHTVYTHIQYIYIVCVCMLIYELNIWTVDYTQQASHLSFSEAQISHFNRWYLEKNARHRSAEAAYFACRDDIDLCTVYFI